MTGTFGTMLRRGASLALISALLGCGGSPSRTAPNGSPIAVIDTACETRIKPFYDALRDLNSRLSVGLNKGAYGERLGDIRVVYDAAIAEGAFEAGACFTTVQKLEKAFNEYIAANGKWDNCIQTTGCEMDTVQPQMQTNWSAAGRWLDEVAIALP